MGKAVGADGPCAWGAWGAGRQQARASLTERTPAAGPVLRGAGQGHTGVLTLPGQRDGVVGKWQQASFRRDAQLRRRLLTSLTCSRYISICFCVLAVHTETLCYQIWGCFCVLAIYTQTSCYQIWGWTSEVSGWRPPSPPHSPALDVICMS